MHVSPITNYIITIFHKKEHVMYYIRIIRLTQKSKKSQSVGRGSLTA